ncbi:MAG: DUF4292 domain-containing protein [Actinobacteria bacterium]|nr:DUF4292 domain-containing protein [Actinomycetota bacterium]
MILSRIKIIRSFTVTRAIIIAMIALVFLAGCASVLRGPAINPQETNWQVVTQILQNNFERLRTLQGWGRLVVETPQMAYNASSTVVFKSPDSLFVKIEAIFGLDVGTLFADRDTYRLYIPSHNTCYTGSTDSMALSQFIAFDLSLDKLIHTLSGLETAQGLSKGILKKDKKGLILWGNDGTYIHKYWIDPKKGVVTRGEIRNKSNQTVLLEEFDRFIRMDGGVIVPRTIRLQRPLEKQSLTLFYENLVVNKKVSEKDFKFKVPQKVLKVTL